jgi:hypothetical protein
MSEDESPWQTKSQIMVTLGKSSRTIDLWVRAGRVERMQDGSRAFFRLATPGNSVTREQPAAPPPELLAVLAEMRDELRALRAEVAALRALPPAELPDGNAALPAYDAQRPRWWRRFLYGPGGKP